LPNIEITAYVHDGVAGDVFDVISDFERYPEHTDAVRRVTIDGRDGATLSSAWEVNFRNGVLHWKEDDVLDSEQRTIRFTQTEGDLDRFDGAWHVDDHPKGCIVRFVARFDLGMPTLAAMLDPIAESALRENIGKIIRGLMDKPVEILTPVRAT
jgi:ribosome-associated toxin RatA of RatAB toxin-antitoxin module